jgi:16S rRNA (guanine966-N2)-methyltransferase
MARPPPPRPVKSKLRVHGGELGGRRLRTPKGVRPSQGVVKEAVFNVLAATLEGTRVIDLFAGSGALGIEALSRGAVAATFVESDHRVIAVLKRNLAELGLLGASRVVQADATRWVELHPGEVGKADIVFADPPYRDPLLVDLVAALDTAAQGLVVLEWAAGDELPALARLEVRRDRAYGSSRLTILAPR